MTTAGTSGFGSLFQGFSRSSYGAQTAWAIDPVLGNDTNVGTPESPLATMAEFSNRYSYILVAAPATLQLVGDVVDSPPWLSGTRFASGASLTVSGTRTTLGTATVSTVSGLGPTTAVMPWDITTTGIDWTTIALGSQLLFSTGHVAFILERLSASRIITSALGLPGIAITNTAPTVSSTITVSSLSRAFPPIVNGASGHAPRLTPQLIFQHLSFDPPAAINTVGVNSYSFAGTVLVQLYGCEMRIVNTCDFVMTTGTNLRCSRITASGSFNLKQGGDTCQSSGLCIVGTGSTFGFNHQQGAFTHSNASVNGCRVSHNGFTTSASYGATHIRNTAGPMLLNAGACVSGSGIVQGATGNTGIGIDVTNGRYTYFSNSKPTVTGASDTRIGGVARTYSQIPFTALQTDAAPNTVTTLTGNGSAMVQE